MYTLVLNYQKIKIKKHKEARCPNLENHASVLSGAHLPKSASGKKIPEDVQINHTNDVQIDANTIGKSIKNPSKNIDGKPWKM